MRARTDLWEPRGGNAPRSPGPERATQATNGARLGATSVARKRVLDCSRSADRRIQAGPPLECFGLGRYSARPIIQNGIPTSSWDALATDVRLRSGKTHAKKLNEMCRTSELPEQSRSPAVCLPNAGLVEFTSSPGGCRESARLSSDDTSFGLTGCRGGETLLGSCLTNDKMLL
jgi:hypothetical protein